MNSVTLVAVNAGLSEPSSTRMLVDRLTDDAVAVLQSHGLSVDVRVIDLRDLVFFGTLTAFFLYVTAVLVDLRKAG